jgi:beta-xylosidase
VLAAIVLAFAAASPASGEPVTGPRANAAMYANPILTDGNPADPHVIFVDGTYYLYPTTHGRGYDVWTSQDLVNWKPGGRVFDDPRGGAWAPDVFHHRRGDGKFYLYYTDDDPDAKPGMLDKRIGVAVSDGPLGPFIDRKVLAKEAIDAHLFQDDDGQMYLYYVDLRGGFKILVQPMADPLTTDGNATEVIRPTEPWEMKSGHVTEGPFMLKRGGVYHLMYSGTGADSPNYAIGYATATSPRGPFKKFRGNPIVERREGLYGPGHHSVIAGPDGKLWMVYHQKFDAGTNFRRFIAVDPLWFDEGVIRARVSRGTMQRGPRSEPHTAQ